MDLKLAGKAALITGGSRGIGRAVATRLAQEGCAVAICGRTAADVDRAVEELWALGARAAGSTVDVLVSGAVEGFVDQAVADLGGADLLVANVGGTVGGGLLDSTPQD